MTTCLRTLYLFFSSYMCRIYNTYFMLILIVFKTFGSITYTSIVDREVKQFSSTINRRVCLFLVAYCWKKDVIGDFLEKDIRAVPSTSVGCGRKVYKSGREGSLVWLLLTVSCFSFANIVYFAFYYLV